MKRIRIYTLSLIVLFILNSCSHKRITNKDKLIDNVKKEDSTYSNLRNRKFIASWDSSRFAKIQFYLNDLVDSLNENKLPFYFLDSCFYCKHYLDGYSSDKLDNLRQTLIDSLPLFYINKMLNYKDSSLLKLTCKKDCRRDNREQNKSTWQLILKRKEELYYQGIIKEIKINSQLNFKYSIKIDTNGYYLKKALKRKTKWDVHHLYKFEKNGILKEYFLNTDLSDENIANSSFREYNYTYDTIHNELIIEDNFYNLPDKKIYKEYQYYKVKRNGNLCLLRYILNGIEFKFKGNVVEYENMKYCK